MAPASGTCAAGATCRAIRVPEFSTKGAGRRGARASEGGRYRGVLGCGVRAHANFVARKKFSLAQILPTIHYSQTQLLLSDYSVATGVGRRRSELPTTTKVEKSIAPAAIRLED